MKGSDHVTLKSVFANSRDQRQVAAGATIFDEGDTGDEMFGVISGKVELRRGSAIAATVGPDGTFGEMAIISGAPRSLTAVASEPSQIAAINRHTFRTPGVFADDAVNVDAVRVEMVDSVVEPTGGEFGRGQLEHRSAANWVPSAIGEPSRRWPPSIEPTTRRDSASMRGS